MVIICSHSKPNQELKVSLIMYVCNVPKHCKPLNTLCTKLYAFPNLKYNLYLNIV